MTGTSGVTAEAAGPRRLEADRLAWYLSAPSLTLGCYPASPWNDLSLDEPEPVAPEDEPAGLPDRFVSAVADCLEGHDGVALLYVNDLASAVLLQHAAELCRQGGRRLLVIVADGVAADGTSLAARSQRTLAHLAPGATSMIVETGRWFRPMPRWGNPAAPDIRHTEFVARASLLAADWGAGALLSPSGADEVLAAPRFLAPHLGVRAAAAYLRDSWRACGPAGLLAEAAAGLGPPPDGLTPMADDAMRSWTSSWIETVTTALATARPAAVDAALRRRIAVTERLVAGYGTVLCDGRGGPAAPAPPRRLPFLDRRVIDGASALPLGRRYVPALPVSYQRTRALLVGLMPPRHREHLPVEAPAPHPDDAYAPARPTGKFPRCTEYGLLTRPVPPPGTGARVLRRLAALEDWLATVPEVGAAS